MVAPRSPFAVERVEAIAVAFPPAGASLFGGPCQEGGVVPAYCGASGAATPELTRQGERRHTPRWRRLGCTTSTWGAVSLTSMVVSLACS
jgi:hypothetical protein